MSWQTEPKINAEDQGGTTVLHVEGDLIRDMPSEWRQTVIEKLDAVRNHGRVVIDVIDVARLGSWGEKRIKSLASAVIGSGGQVAVVTDPNRSAMYAGLEVELRSIDSGVRITVDLADAINNVGELS